MKPERKQFIFLMLDNAGNRSSALAGHAGMMLMLHEVLQVAAQRTVCVGIYAAREGIRGELEVICDIEPGGNMPSSPTELAEITQQLGGGGVDEVDWVPGYAGVDGLEMTRLPATRSGARGRCNVEVFAHRSAARQRDWCSLRI